MCTTLTCYRKLVNLCEREGDSTQTPQTLTKMSGKSVLATIRHLPVG